MSIAGQTIDVTNDIGIALQQPYSMIDASFAASIIETREEKCLTRLVHPSSLTVCTCKGGTLNVPGMLPLSKSIGIIMTPNSDTPNSSRV